LRLAETDRRPGAVAGFLAGLIMEGGGFGLIGNIIVGILGAAVAGYLFPRLGVSIPSPIRLSGQSPFPQLAQSYYFSLLVSFEDDDLASKVGRITSGAETG
jgi:hypothetical protein